MHRTPLHDRFWKHVNKTPTCWLWTGSQNDSGYGMINLGGKHGKIERAHRVSWLLHNGPVLDDLCVCHHCDNPPCIRPDHLFLGTREDNNHDMQHKNRYDRIKRPRGEAHGNAKLTSAAVLDIRARTGTQPLHKLATEYGVSVTTINRIQRNLQRNNG